MQGRSLKEGHIQQGNKQLNELRIYPTQKPVKLYEWILQQYARPGWLILDPTMGSGSSWIAAHRQNLPYIGIERDPQHFEDACNRWAAYQEMLYLRPSLWGNDE